MSLIINIDTSNKIAQVILSDKDGVIDILADSQAMEHASFLQPAIKRILEKNHIDFNDIKAVSVVNGPGSYTGLRIGLAGAKGICHVLGLPLIAHNTLDVIAHSLKNRIGPDFRGFICPMIDARRMEVFTALYKAENLEKISNVEAKVLDENFIQEYLPFGSKIVFGGDGAGKFKASVENENYQFANEGDLSVSIAKMSYERLLHEQFDDLILTEPFYSKAFYSTIKLNK
ncbi:tRNA (adenosine(37)-N6)-threonylcarbamoyltransferase complex dimerization subunit type 1 TsaB [Polluticaenibacter yanchengensis]|uniref:tRNA (Adenosine(37)-N6)-threonylcarbamoyltransferase complex dimerization subunit type 1 TsaB n=1 Tax=Polluticaenibacter yanchengensis TaxID=3014562 RepID=A0ABT4ULU2_9BACT|nr:tRNA (adenosine(37)-N6)-threonylcarbamoyltransferase complex dimerization subunit type 1 TsaB [Chitinophagaceae bacterium LY-5]